MTGTCLLRIIVIYSKFLYFYVQYTKTRLKDYLEAVILVLYMHNVDRTESLQKCVGAGYLINLHLIEPGYYPMTSFTSASF